MSMERDHKETSPLFGKRDDVINNSKVESQYGSQGPEKDDIAEDDDEYAASHGAPKDDRLEYVLTFKLICIA